MVDGGRVKYGAERTLVETSILEGLRNVKRMFLKSWVVGGGAVVSHFYTRAGAQCLPRGKKANDAVAKWRSRGADPEQDKLV